MVRFNVYFCALRLVELGSFNNSIEGLWLKIKNKIVFVSLFSFWGILALCIFGWRQWHTKVADYHRHAAVRRRLHDNATLAEIAYSCTPTSSSVPFHMECCWMLLSAFGMNANESGWRRRVSGSLFALVRLSLDENAGPGEIQRCLPRLAGLSRLIGVDKLGVTFLM